MIIRSHITVLVDLIFQLHHLTFVASTYIFLNIIKREIEHCFNCETEIPTNTIIVLFEMLRYF